LSGSVLEAFALTVDFNFIITWQAKKKHSLNQEDNPKSQEVLGERIKEVKIKKEALESTGANITRNVPPYDASATTPQEAYPLDKIILTGEWGFLEDIFELLEAGANVPPNTYPTFVCNRIHKLQEIQVWFKKVLIVFLQIT
jgi:DNA-directed RNA polymerase I subunit RPA49